MPTSLPDYVIEPPDVLLIDAVKIVPKAPYTIDTLDFLRILVPGAPEDAPVNSLLRSMVPATSTLARVTVR